MQRPGAVAMAVGEGGSDVDGVVLTGGAASGPSAAAGAGGGGGASQRRNYSRVLSRVPAQVDEPSLIDHAKSLLESQKRQ